MFADVLAAASAPFHALVQSSSRLFWLYLLTAGVIALIVHFPARRPSLAAACSDARAWGRTLTHRSSVIDGIVYVVNFFLVRLVPWLVAAGLIIGNADAATFELLTALAGPAGVSHLSHAALVCLSTVAMFLAIDFSLWLLHYLQHRVGFLWELHKVHHSAEVLTPLTVYRTHPLDDWLNVTGSAAAIGAVQGFLRYVAGYPVQGATFLGLNILLFAFYALGFNLRHSHAWVAYHPSLSHVFISPAQHQIHHSVAPRHHDKNFGFALAFWDWLAGTLYVPEGREQLNFGLSAESGGFSSLREIYLSPLVAAFRRLTREASSAIALACIVLGFVALSSCRQREQEVRTDQSLFIEQMTWNEVRDRIDGGFDTVLVPTGGVEQNGFHLVTGKHNTVIAHTVVRIAEEVGYALVAPVIPLSPEGEYDPPTLHMRYPGTISLPDPVFEAVLESTARSLKVHGFRTICFIGDSGGSQEAQRKVAAKLSHEWQGEVQVLHVSNYYGLNGQFAWLRAQGESEQAIGAHAGIRDTSELLALDPAGVRSGLLEWAAGHGGAESGSSGDPTRASYERGMVMLRLKIAAATEQIRSAKVAPAVSQRQE